MKRNHSRWKRIAAMFLAVLLTVLSQTAVWAEESPEGVKTCTLTVESRYGKKPVEGAEFSIYQVADVDDLGNFTLRSGYQDAGVEVNNLTKSSQWKKAAEKLAVWIKQQKRKAAAESTTDETGKAAFAGIQAGLYLLEGQEVSTAGGILKVSPVLVVLPEAGKSGSEREYDVTVKPKNEFLKETETETESQKQTETETETESQKQTETETETESETESESIPHLPDEYGNLKTHDPQGETGNDGSGESGKLPQTGQLKWPVPVLAAAGIWLTGMGLWMRKGKKDE